MSKWDGYEPYKGGDRPTLPKWAEKLIVPAFMLLAIAVVGIVGWFLGIMVYVRVFSRVGNLATNTSDAPLYAAGTIGAAIAIVVTITWHFKTKRPL